ncbi:DNA repair protein RadA [Corynebacterium sp. TAE3-ERU2]|uniref:DNA repair protein RadA n=1 Tax=Corynebacterium sp. TAE3-ERU2 TaxID=2849497 RepID=UPI001C4621CD|nr:DNA repair protein RadA [Corynebacterium sp. TAE3-ERU2]MBV7301588.1 DNA repair protein RadA [Corynebacterium sp. TAE3-ERU2]
MARKPKTAFVCSECGHSSPKWLGRCPSCGEWGTLTEQAAPAQHATGRGGAAASRSTQGLTPTTAAASITSIDPTSSLAMTTGISELDRVLGAGIVPGSVVLMAGEPGVGKSTLLLEVAARWAAQREGESTRTALYVTAEESAGQVRMRAERTGGLRESLYLAAESDLDTIFGHITQLQPSLVIVDSVQTVTAADVDGVQGGVAQSRAVTAALTSMAKASGIPVLLVGHVTKDGTVAGPRVLEHLVDVVLNFEGDKHSSLRMLRGMKNRFGATDEVGCFEQTSSGIKEVKDPSGLFLSHMGTTPDGSAVTVTMDGVRPILAEVQALLVDTQSKNPRRAVTGLDATRVPMILAVLAARAQKRSDDKEVYVATVGGMRVSEPAADLAVALATVSAMNRRPLPSRTVVLGEVGLAGEIRRVPDADKRLVEASRLGYTRALIPAGNLPAGAPKGARSMDIREVATIQDAIVALDSRR